MYGIESTNSRSMETNSVYIHEMFFQIAYCDLSRGYGWITIREQMTVIFGILIVQGTLFIIYICPEP